MYSFSPAIPGKLRGLAVAGVAAGALLLASPAMAATSSTTVTPAGDGFQATVASGTTAGFAAGSVSVSCNASQASGTIPTDNTNPSGPITSTVTPATFTGCSTNIAFVTASAASNNTKGDWSIALQYDPAGSTGTLTIPQGGVVLTNGGLASCTTVVAPDAPITIPGTWTPGTATSAPQLVFDNVSVPISVTGGMFCPVSSTAGTFSATYDVTDTTTPSAQVTVAS
jgi:hypothetical protein